jgi:hypothetical protein
LDKLARRKEYLNFCKAKNPQNYKELYSEFLYVLVRKEDSFFDQHIDKKCYSIIKYLSMPNSSVRAVSAKERVTDYGVDLNQFENIPTTLTPQQRAVEIVIDQEEYWYNKRIFELILQGYSLTSIRRLTKDKIPYNELLRVKKLLKNKIKKQYKILCSKQ